jgi:hypothetical protein
MTRINTKSLGLGALFIKYSLTFSFEKCRSFLHRIGDSTFQVRLSCLNYLTSFTFVKGVNSTSQTHFLQRGCISDKQELRALNQW